MKMRLTFSSSGFIFDRDASEQGEKKGIFRLGNNEPRTTRTSELNTVDSWNKENLI